MKMDWVLVVCHSLLQYSPFCLSEFLKCQRKDKFGHLSVISHSSSPVFSLNFGYDFSPDMAKKTFTTKLGHE